MRNLVVQIEKWISILQLEPVLYRVFRSPGIHNMILGAPLPHYNYLSQKLKTLRKASVMMELNCGTHYLQICVIQIHYQHS